MRMTSLFFGRPVARGFFARLLFQRCVRSIVCVEVDDRYAPWRREKLDDMRGIVTGNSFKC